MAPITSSPDVLAGMSHTGMVHAAKRVRHIFAGRDPELAGKLFLAQRCGMPRGQRHYLSPVADGTPITCKRCLAKLEAEAAERPRVAMALTPSGLEQVAAITGETVDEVRAAAERQGFATPETADQAEVRHAEARAHGAAVEADADAAEADALERERRALEEPEETATAPEAAIELLDAHREAELRPTPWSTTWLQHALEAFGRVVVAAPHAKQLPAALDLARAILREHAQEKAEEVAGEVIRAMDAALLNAEAATEVQGFLELVTAEVSRQAAERLQEWIERQSERAMEARA